MLRLNLLTLGLLASLSVSAVAGADDTLAREQELSALLARYEAERRNDAPVGSRTQPRAWFAAFDALSRRGSSTATLWCLEHYPMDAPEVAGDGQRVALDGLHLRWIDQRPPVGSAGREASLGELERYLERLGEHGRTILGRERADELLRELDRRAEDAGVRAWILLTRARLQDARQVRDARRRERARELYDELERRFPDSRAAHQGREDGSYLEHMSVGSVVPGFVSHDAAGNEIRLSDFRGQVTVVRFSDDRGAVANERLDREQELVLELWDERFALIGVHVGDPDRALRRRLRRLATNWTHALEPEEGGAATGAWRVRTLPGTYLIDANGVLRGIDLQGPALKARILELLAELRAQTAARQVLQQSERAKHR